MTIIRNIKSGGGGVIVVGDDGLAITTSNVLLGRTPTVTSPGVDEVPLNISSPDHSFNYTSGAVNDYFSVDYGVVQNVSYTAISGHNAAGNIGVTIELYDGITLVDSVTMTRNNNVMFTYTTRSFTNMILKFVTATPTQQVTVSFIASGAYLNIETGEQAGYSRNWLNRSATEKVTTNLMTAPVTVTKKSKALKGTLTLPNETAVFSQGLWQDFMDFSYEQPFFIKEVSGRPDSTYTCFNPKHTIKAHPQTRLMDSITLSFNAFNGL